MTSISSGQQSASEPGTGRLPLELTSYIINYFATGLYQDNIHHHLQEHYLYLAPPLAANLLSLRLVSKSWEPIVIPLYLASTEIQNSIQAQAVIHILKKNRLDSGSWPIKRITFGNLDYESSQYPEAAAAHRLSQLDDGAMASIESSNPSAVSHDQAAELIHLLSENVTELHLRYGEVFGFSSAFVKAVGRLKCLKILSICPSFAPPDNRPARDVLDLLNEVKAVQEAIDGGRTQLPDTELAPSDSHEVEGLAALLDATPDLEFLDIIYDELKPMKFASRTLSKLSYFYFSYAEEAVEGITCICKQAKDTLKVIEYDISDGEECPEIGPVFEAIRSTIEGVFVGSATSQIPWKISRTIFPRLRVLRTQYGDDVICKGAFPDWPMLRTIRTLVMDPDGDDFSNYPRHLPNLKQMMFYAYPRKATLDENEVKKFDSCGIKCHLITHCDASKIMELDLKLNGPMD